MRGRCEFIIGLPPGCSSFQGSIDSDGCVRRSPGQPSRPCDPFRSLLQVGCVAVITAARELITRSCLCIPASISPPSVSLSGKARPKKTRSHSMTRVLRWRLSGAPAEGSGMPRTSQPGRSVSSRVLDVLFAFRPGRSRLTLAELTRSTGLPYATVRRLVNEVLVGGVLEREPDGYVIGVRLWELGTLAPRTVPLRAAALPFMEDLRTAVR